MLDVASLASMSLAGLASLRVFTCVVVISSLSRRPALRRVIITAVVSQYRRDIPASINVSLDLRAAVLYGPVTYLFVSGTLTDPIVPRAVVLPRPLKHSRGPPAAAMHSSVCPTDSRTPRCVAGVSHTVNFQSSIIIFQYVRFLMAASKCGEAASEARWTPW